MMANDDPHLLNLYDWAELLNMEDAMIGLQTGVAYPRDVRMDIDGRREEYLNLPLDYFRALDAMAEYIEQVEDAIKKQNDVLAEFSQSLAEMGWSYSWDHNRLLTEIERDKIRLIEARIEEEIGKQHRRKEELEAMAADIEALIAELEEQAEQVQGNIEDILAQIEDLESQMEMDL